MNGNKKIAKKIVAGSMAVMMAAGLAGTYEYHNNVMQVQAAEQKDKDTQELKETAENVLADHATDSEDTGFYHCCLFFQMVHQIAETPDKMHHRNNPM